MGGVYIAGFLVGGAMFLVGLFSKNATWTVGGALMLVGSLLLGADWRAT